ncbi:MAG: FtsQ-type POTRA domain-containing protein [Candidatus Acidiferrales bacterium]
MNADAYPQEVLADEEPKYLRRQKPLEIKRRKFGKKAWKTYARLAVWSMAGVVFAGTGYLVGNFLLSSKEMALLRPDQLTLKNAHYVATSKVMEIFRADRNRSVLRVPLEERRRQLEAIPWVEHATVMRALPNRIEVDIKERTPIAFLREGNVLALVDAHGVILERPLKADFHFPVVTGISEDMPLEDREQRMQMYSSFSEQVESAKAGAMDQVNEVDLTEAKNLSATIIGLQSGVPSANVPSGSASGPYGGDPEPLVVHFGDTDFKDRYLALISDIGKWNTAKGRLKSVDLRFTGEAVAVPETTLLAQNTEPAAAPAKAAASAPAKRSHPAPKRHSR